MEAEITIHVSSHDEDAPIREFIEALETLLTWQWDNAILTSEVLED